MKRPLSIRRAFLLAYLGINSTWKSISEKRQYSAKNRHTRNAPCEPLSAIRFFCFLFFGASAWHRKPPQQVYSSAVYIYRARSLRNLLVSGNECGRVFPAGVGPGSPSRDAANWLPSRFSLSVETRRRYGWLRMMVFPGARLFPSPNLVPFGRVAARERQGALPRRAW